jgi:hypothetical protein
VEKVVLDALREVQQLGGHEWKKPPADLPVIGALEGFDSLTGIEATALVEKKLAEKLGRTDPVELKLDSIFVSPDGSKALSLADVVSTVSAAMESHA